MQVVSSNFLAQPYFVRLSTKRFRVDVIPLIDFQEHNDSFTSATNVHFIAINIDFEGWYFGEVCWIQCEC